MRNISCLSTRLILFIPIKKLIIFSYWEKSGGYLLDNSEKYRIDNSAEKDGYRSKMQLNITRINSDDYIDYKCISKNEEGRIEGTIHLKRKPLKIHSSTN